MSDYQSSSSEPYISFSSDGPADDDYDEEEPEPQPWLQPEEIEHPRRENRDDDGSESDSSSDCTEGAEATPEQWKELEKELDKVVAFMKDSEAAKATETDPVKRYKNLCQLSMTLKIMSPRDGGWKILHDKRTEAEQLAIDRANFDILKFVYARHPIVLSRGESFIGRLENIDRKLAELITQFVANHDKHSFRAGNFSVAVGFDEFPPVLKWRTTAENKTIMLRPVLVDGVAVLNATMDDDTWKPFADRTRYCENWIYEPDLNLPVKPLVDIILLFLIRGHKVKVYLPKYYEDFVSDCGVSKVDDLVAFRTLVALDFIKFQPITEAYNYKWFNVVSGLADRSGAVFVSSAEYRTSKTPIEYSKSSERIITPCFLNADDRLMVLDPTIRYRKTGESNYTNISSDEILQFTDQGDDRMKLGEQLFLEHQIELICSLCKLYPVKLLNKVAIKQLLELVVFAEADFEMPGMSVTDYEQLYNRFERGEL